METIQRMEVLLLLLGPTHQTTNQATLIYQTVGLSSSIESIFKCIRKRQSKKSSTTHCIHQSYLQQ